MTNCLKCEHKAEHTIISTLGSVINYCEKHYKEYERVQDEVSEIMEHSFYEDDF